MNNRNWVQAGSRTCGVWFNNSASSGPAQLLAGHHCMPCATRQAMVMWHEGLLTAGSCQLTPPGQVAGWSATCPSLSSIVCPTEKPAGRSPQVVTRFTQ